MNPSSPGKQVLLLGLGNDILADDSIGLRVVQTLRERRPPDPRLDFIDTCEMGLSLLDFIEGYRQVLLVDAVQTRQVPPGFIHEINVADLPTLPQYSPHFLGVGEVMALGKLLGLAMPEKFRIYAVEVADPFTVKTELTPIMEQALPGILAHLENALAEALKD